MPNIYITRYYQYEQQSRPGCGGELGIRGVVDAAAVNDTAMRGAVRDAVAGAAYGQ